MPTTTVHLVDASPYIFRSFFVMPASIVDPAGRPVGAVRGFASFLLKLVEDEQPTHLGVAFDESLTTSFRNERYPDYKAQRDRSPDSRVASARRAETFVFFMGCENR